VDNPPSKKRIIPVIVVSAAFLSIYLIPKIMWEIVLPTDPIALFISGAVIPSMYMSSLLFKRLLKRETDYKNIHFWSGAVVTYFFVGIIGGVTILVELISDYQGFVFIKFMNDMSEAMGFVAIENSTTRSKNAVFILTSILYMEFCKVFVRPWKFMDTMCEYLK